MTFLRIGYYCLAVLVALHGTELLLDHIGKLTYLLQSIINGMIAATYSTAVMCMLLYFAWFATQIANGAV